MTPPTMSQPMSLDAVLKLQESYASVASVINEAQLGKALSEGFSVDLDHWQSMLGVFKDAGLLTQADVNNIIKVRNMAPKMNLFSFIAIACRLCFNYFDATTSGAVEKMMQAGNKVTRPALPSAYQVIQAAFVAPEKTPQVREILARLGYPEEMIDLQFIAQYKLYDELTIRDLYLREAIDQTTMFTRMRELGYTDTRINEIVKGWSIIPPVQDILTMVGHEAFEPDSIKQMGLDNEFPAEQAEWLTKQGLSPYWQMKYWISHWEQPSIQMGYEMLQRGVIDRADLEFLFRTVEIPPYWREKLLKIAFSPFTRVDARRMYKLGVLTEEDLLRVYKDIGYDDWHAQKLAEFTKRDALGAEKDLSKSEVLKAYKERITTEDEAKKLLVKMKYDENEATYLLALEDYKRDQEIQTDLIAAVEKRYKRNVIDRAEARRLLDAMALPSDAVEGKLAKWDAAVIQDEKLPTKSDLDKFYLTGIIQSDTYESEMRKLGYTSQAILWYVRLLELQVEVATSE